jgi:hypothetical protein
MSTVISMHNSAPHQTQPVLKITRHAEARIRQRGFREDDVTILMKYGREMPNGTLVLTDRDVRREMEMMRRHISRLDRLRGMTAVVIDGRVVTVYRADKSSRHRRPRQEG